MIWIIIDHPQQLMTALGLIQKYNIFRNDINLIISNHPYHKNIELEYENYFHNVYIFDRVNLGRNILRDTVGLITQKIKVNLLIKKFEKNDILIGLSTCQVLENMFLSSLSNIIKIAIVTETQNKYAYKNLSDYAQYPRMLIYKPLMKSLGLYEVFSGLLKGYSSKTKDGIDALRYIKFIDSIYDHIFYMVNVDNDKNDYLIKYKNSYKLNYLSYKEDCEKKEKKEVIFFGNCFLVFNNFPQDKYAENTNKFLGYIRKFYSDCDLIYIPHPKETIEYKKLNLSKFTTYTGGLNAELYFQKNYCNIDACFSIASTVTRNALAYNIQSYSFLKIMGFDKQQENYFLNLYGNIQDEIYITSLEKQPNIIVFEENNVDKLKELLIGK
jgi:hypothetical protein